MSLIKLILPIQAVEGFYAWNYTCSCCNA